MSRDPNGGALVNPVDPLMPPEEDPLGRDRRPAVACALVLASCAWACRLPVEVAPPPPPRFPPELSTQTMLHNGVILTASGTIVSTEPTVIRVTAALSNPTDDEVTMGVGARECRVIAVAYWEGEPGGRAVAPPDGYLGPTQPSACRGVANGFQITIAAGETLMLPDTPLQFTLSEVLLELEEEFVPGRFVIGALILSDFEYEVLALDAVIDD